MTCTSFFIKLSTHLGKHWQMGPCHPYKRSECSSRLLHSDLSSSGLCGHIGSGITDVRFFFSPLPSLLPSLSLFFLYLSFLPFAFYLLPHFPPFFFPSNVFQIGKRCFRGSNIKISETNLTQQMPIQDRCVNTHFIVFSTFLYFKIFPN